MRMPALLIVMLSCFATTAAGADLVLHVGAGTHRIALQSASPLRVANNELRVTPVASSGAAGDGWCPTSGGTSPAGAGVLLVIGGSTVRIATGAARIEPLSGDIHVTPSASSGASGDGWCPSGSGSPPVFTAPLSATPATLPGGGGNSTLSWATSGATSCTASSTPAVAAWTGSKPVIGNTVVSLTTAGTYAFSLSCTGAGGTRAATPITVTVGSAPTDCSARPPPSELSRQTSMVNRNLGNTSNQQNSEFPIGSIIAVDTYSPLLGNVFNQPDQAARVFIDTGKYVAMGFSTSSVSVGATGSVHWSQSGIAPGVLTVMISPCPGDFEWPIDSNCRTSSGEAYLGWKVGTKPATNPGLYCYLNPSQTYYINAVFATPTNGFGTTSCAGSYCDWLISPVGGI